ncbi:DUF2480 family protein [Hyphobacterium sp. CCMP332]|nr:DUF2480 family protein [Hyphobacterium sp. CCMP332]
MEREIVNRVANSKLITINPEDFVPEGERMIIDLKEILHQGMILREADFRSWAKENDWDKYKNAFVAITCSVDAIIPQWAYMVIASKLSGIAKSICKGNIEDLEKELFRNELSKLNPQEFLNKPVVIKGCSDSQIPDESYVWITEKIKPYVKSIMYGEPCSTVPVYKAPKKN